MSGGRGTGSFVVSRYADVELVLAQAVWRLWHVPWYDDFFLMPLRASTSCLLSVSLYS